MGATGVGNIENFCRLRGDDFFVFITHTHTISHLTALNGMQNISRKARTLI